MNCLSRYITFYTLRGTILVFCECETPSSQFPPIPHKMGQSEHDSETLVTAIQQTFMKSTFPIGRDEHYSPEGSLNSIITKISIEKALTSPTGWRRRPRSPQKELVDFTLQKATKLFAICVFIDLKGEKLRTTATLFLREEICDQDLPIDRQTLNTSARFSCFRGPGWDPSRRENLLRFQWYFLAPRFLAGGATERVTFQPQTLFPFELMSERPPRGAFGAVYKVKVHPSHFDHSQVRYHAVFQSVRW